MAPFLTRLTGRTEEQKQAARRELAALQSAVLEEGLKARGIQTRSGFVLGEERPILAREPAGSEGT
jgi:hypothetical protein